MATTPKNDKTGKRNKKGGGNYQKNAIENYLKLSQNDVKSGLDDRIRD